MEGRTTSSWRILEVVCWTRLPCGMFTHTPSDHRREHYWFSTYFPESDLIVQNSCRQDPKQAIVQWLAGLPDDPQHSTPAHSSGNPTARTEASAANDNQRVRRRTYAEVAQSKPWWDCALLDDSAPQSALDPFVSLLLPQYQQVHTHSILTDIYPDTRMQYGQTIPPSWVFSVVQCG